MLDFLRRGRWCGSVHTRGAALILAVLPMLRPTVGLWCGGSAVKVVIVIRIGFPLGFVNGADLVFRRTV